MLKRLCLPVVLFAWLMATGAQWDAVQTYGWGRMFANYSRTMPWSKAIERTFSGEMCGVCRTVAAAKQQERENAPVVPGNESGTKVLLVYQPAASFVFSLSEPSAWPPSDQQLMGMPRAAPPVPPPRNLLV